MQHEQNKTCNNNFFFLHHMNKFITTALLAVGLTGSAFATTPSDLILGFRDTSNPANNLEIDLGQASALAGGSGTVTLTNLLSLGSSSINTVYGSGWNTSSTLLWGVAGTSGTTTTTRTLWASSVANSSLLDGVATTTAYNGGSVTGQATPASKIATVYAGLTAVTSGNVAVLDATGGQSWSVNETPTLAFGKFAIASFENNTAITGNYVASDIYQIAPVSGQAGSYIGTVAIWANGDVTFSTIPLAPVPEPSTYAAILGAAVLGFVIYHRRMVQA